MLINKETDYALRILRGLSDYERHTMTTLCESQDVPKQFGYKIIKKLANASMIDSIRGVDGGCKLICDLKQVTLYDLLQAIDQSAPIITACMEPGYVCPWQEKTPDICSIHCQLAKVQASLNDELQSHSLSKIIFG